MELIDRDKAIETLMKIKKKKESCNCSRQTLREATAIGYAIEVLKKLPTEGHVLQKSKMD